MSPNFHIFVRDGDTTESGEEAQLAVVSINAWEVDGVRHMRVNGTLEELLEALLDSSGILVAVNAGEFPEA
jgi:hypothetical protein